MVTYRLPPEEEKKFTPLEREGARPKPGPLMRCAVFLTAFACWIAFLIVVYAVVLVIAFCAGAAIPIVALLGAAHATRKAMK